jgi:hypothetical protein
MLFCTIIDKNIQIAETIRRIHACLAFFKKTIGSLAESGLPQHFHDLFLFKIPPEPVCSRHGKRTDILNIGTENFIDPVFYAAN